METTDVVLLESFEILAVVRRTLSKIDPRLVDHGERVGYIARQICAAGAGQELDPSRLFVLCLLHDIGAYKTDEIDEMVRFETETPYEHALYGYLFLKNTSHLADCAEALLYHHTDYAALQADPPPYAAYAEMIFLADRADILLSAPHPDLNRLRRFSGTKFHPAYVDALLRAEESTHFSEKLISGAYQSEVHDTLHSLAIPNAHILEYLKLLVYAIDFRSPYTVTHTADTTLLSQALGRRLGLSQRELQCLYIGAFLHDIGKIAIPHDILEKPGRLTPEEYEIVKRHIPEGEAILRGVVSDEICDIALRHHEKLDGSGYAHGLTGEHLTLSQRIVAVADILSALSQRRSYKEPFPKEKVLAILSEMRDAGQLCPRVVDAVCRDYDQLLREVEQSHDPLRQVYRELTAEYAVRRAALMKR